MKCEDVQLQISELLLQGVAPESDPEVRSHLESCPDCQSHADDLAEVMAALLYTETIEAPQNLKGRLFAHLQAGLSCEQAQTLVVDRLTGGIQPTDETALQSHLAQCEACSEYARDMDLVMIALPHSVAEQHPPAQLKNRVLQAVKTTKPQKPSRLLQWWGLGLAATVSGVLWAGGLLSPSASASLAPHPSVVVSAGNQVVFANSTRNAAPIVVLDQDGKATGLKLQMNEVPYFTEAVSEGSRIYLLDTGNQQLIVVNLTTLQVERIHKVHAGASGLSVRKGRVFVKCALSGFLTSIGQDGFVTEIKLAATRDIPQEEFMDAVLQQDNLLWVTHHMGGKVFLVNPDTLQVQRTLDVGGEPVALNRYGSHVLVLDHAGRLLELSGNRILRELALEGHPDKMTVASGQAYLSDRTGQVSKVDLSQWKVVKTAAFGTPMDLATTPEGELLLADAQQGINILDTHLQVTDHIP